MTPEKIDAITGVLADHPDGLTAKQAAAILGWTGVITSQRLGMMFFQGRVLRRQRDTIMRANNTFVYTSKPAPAPQWRPALRMPGRAIRERASAE